MRASIVLLATLITGGRCEALEMQPIRDAKVVSVCTKTPLTTELQDACYGWDIWDVEPLPAKQGETRLTLRAMDDAVMYGWLTVTDIDIRSAVAGAMTVQRRDYTLRTPWRLEKVSKKRSYKLTSYEIDTIISVIERSNFWKLPHNISQPPCVDGTPVVVEAVKAGNRNIVSQNVACDDGRSGVGPLDKAIWKIVYSRVCHNKSDNCEVF